MGMNGDDLTAAERSELRHVVVEGVQTLRARRRRATAFAGGALALILVGGISGGAVAAGAYLGASSAATPSPSVTPTAVETEVATPSLTPTPTAAPTKEPTVDRSACGGLLSDAEATVINGEDVVSLHTLRAYDPAVVGGISCSWADVDDGWWTLSVEAYPRSEVPEEGASRAGVVPDCLGGAPCEYAEFAGDVWVTAVGGSSAEVVEAVQAAIPRAATAIGSARKPDDAAWTVPSCEDLRDFIAAQLSRTDLRPYAGDAMPNGMAWETATRAGIASWCSSLGDGLESGSMLEEIEVYLGPGTSSVPAEALAEAASAPIEVPHAGAAWISNAHAPTKRLIAVSDSNTILVTSRFLDDATMAALAGALIEQLDAAPF